MHSRSQLNRSKPKISLVIPIHNEAESLNELYEELVNVTDKLPAYDFEFVLVNDGSRDDSGIIIKKLSQEDSRIVPIELIRNSGKEIALTAGLHHSSGDAAITMDADLQHPPRYIPDFIKEWQNGAPIVVGSRTNSENRSLFRSISTKLFYAVINQASSVKISPEIMDFRLIDREVIDHFNKFTERNRIARGLIDWLGYPQTLLPVEIPERLHGTSTYSTWKLFKLARDSFISMSLLPLKFAGYLGVAIMAVFGPFGLYVVIDQAFMGDQLNVSGAASVGILTAFMVGVILFNLGLIALYIANMHDESLGRPLYVRSLNYSRSTVKKITDQPTKPSKPLLGKEDENEKVVVASATQPEAKSALVPKNILWFSWKDQAHPQAGGAELLGTSIRENLAKDGHNVTLITSTFGGAKHTETVNNIRIIRMGSRYTVHFKAMIYYLKNKRKLNAELVIDEVNTAPFFARWYTRKPTYLFFHQLAREIWYHEMPPVLSTIGFIGEAIYLRLLSGQKAITVSPSSKKDLQRFGFKSKNISIISEGIELKPLASPGELQKFNNPTLLALGSVRSMKQTLHQIKAFELAKPTAKNLRLIIAGDTTGKYGQKVTKYIQNSKYSKDIELKGRVSEAEKIKLMQKSHWLLVTSIKEGWCLVVTEAASQGLPAIVYDADGLRDSVRHKLTGFVVKPRPKAMSEAILDVLGLNRSSENKDESTRGTQNLTQKHYHRIQTAAWEMSKEITLEQSYQDFKKVIKA